MTDLQHDVQTVVPRAFALLLCLLFGLGGAARAGGLPPRIAPAPPFPRILSQTFERDFVTPGVWLGRYYLMTKGGPLVIHALSVDLQTPGVRMDTVVASDRLISKGETVSSMAQRTGALAGVNADFFDIGNTFQPLGMLVHDGALLRSPSGRAVMTITKEHAARFESFRFGGTVQDGDGRTWPLTSFNGWPPEGGAALLSPALGTIPPEPGEMLAALTPLGGPAYRVDAVFDATVPHEPMLALAFGPSSMKQNGVPHAGDDLNVSFDTDPPLDDVAAAIGGGPLLVHDGVNFDDPLPPAAAEALKRVPLSGALRQDDGTIVLLQVDGREPKVSVGVTRAAFASLLRALGAVDGMAFDGGGSSTLVARSPGDRIATVQNVPSDGHERDVADGVFVYSDTPLGPPAQLIVRHGPMRMLRGASEAIQTAVLDAAGHVLDVVPAPVHLTVLPKAIAHVSAAGSLHAGSVTGEGMLRAQQGALTADVPMQIVDHVATLRIEPEHPNPQPGTPVSLHAVAFNRSGAPIDVEGRVAWSAPGGSIASDGTYHTGQQDAIVVARVAGKRAQALVRVGQSDLPIDVFRHDSPTAAAWTFATAPAGQAGSVEIDDDNSLAISYDFTHGERAAYANTSVHIDGELLSLTVDVQGDGSGAALRLAVTSGDGDRLPITLSRRIDWQGWRTLTLRLPREAVSPLTLDAFYLVAPRDTTPLAGAGTIALRNLRGTFAGTSTPNPPYRL